MGRPRTDPAERAPLARDLRWRYESGASIRELCADTGRSYGMVYKLLAEAGTPMRSRGGARKRG